MRITKHLAATEYLYEVITSFILSLLVSQCVGSSKQVCQEEVAGIEYVNLHELFLVLIQESTIKQVSKQVGDQQQKRQQSKQAKQQAR